MTQSEYNQLTESASEAIAMYCNGLITLPELVNNLTKLDLSDCKGLVDTQSGLRLAA